MKLKELYDHFIEAGIKNDPRGADSVRQSLANAKKKYDEMSSEEKSDFDLDTLTNPYTDSRILFAKGDEEVKTVIIGIDMETPEILLAHSLRASGKQIDMVMTHHPEGKAYATFYNVMGMQADILNKFGVPISFAESVTEHRLKEVGRKVMPQNHARAVDAARLLGIPFISAHTVADNHVTTYLQSIFDTKPHTYIGDIIKTLKEIPEYKEAMKGKAGPMIVAGSEKSRAGKVAPLDITGGTEPSAMVYEKLADAGVGTIIAMHAGEEHRKECAKHHINLVVAGHMSSDSLGMNLFLDELEKHGVKIISCSGLIRVKREK